MPASISSAPSPAAAAAQLAVNGGNPAGDGQAAASGGDMSPFAALFQKLAAQQAIAAVSPVSDPIIELGAAPNDDVLSALLPFLEAMGLLKESGGESEETAVTDIPAEPGQALALAAPSTPAIPAAGHTPDVQEHDVVVPSPADSARKAKQPLNMQASPGAEPAGREFSSQLVAAIEEAHLQPQAPGNIAAAVQQVIAKASPQQANAAAMPALPVAAPVGTANWSEEIGNRLVWMAGRHESRAELVLTPPHMGRVEVSLSINGDQANASFASVNPVVRDALEAALPRLREALAEAGIQLGQAQVGAENARQWSQQGKNGDNFGFDRGAGSGSASNQVAGESIPAASGLKTGRGLVDVFA
jgi:flagellar hook-length control protein FliK